MTRNRYEHLKRLERMSIFERVFPRNVEVTNTKNIEYDSHGCDSLTHQNNADITIYRLNFTSDHTAVSSSD